MPRYWYPGWNSVQSLGKLQGVFKSVPGTSSGVRLLEPDRREGKLFYIDVPQAFVPGPRRQLALPMHHIFGTEELSAQAPGVAELTPQPRVVMSRDDAAELGVGPGATVHVLVGEKRFELQVEVAEDLPRGLAGLPVSLPGVPRLDHATWVEVLAP
jgi:NADH-quinone oxidoreductase subunit G